MATTFEAVHFFGIRHHGPGCAHSLKQALDALQADCVLIEGPPEGETLLDWVGHEALVPPVALLVYAQNQPEQASFYPLAVFSPEWQALLWAKQQRVPVQFFDLPHTHKLALETQQQQRLQEANTQDDSTLQAPEDLQDAVNGILPPSPDMSDSSDAADENSIENDYADPLDMLAQAAGYDDGETWWNRLVEERHNSQDVFAAINEAMTAVREQIPQLHANFQRQYSESLREAWMRQRIRAAIKQGFQRIAVVCGAWHVPALQDAQHTIKADAALLKGLPKLKTETTWAPWSYPHLAYASGYAAGVVSPGWYEHLWQHKHLAATPTQRTVSWLRKAAILMREQDWDCSSAHLIEAARLADILAIMRGHASASLEEINEAISTVIHMGETLPLLTLHEQLTIGTTLGQVPVAMPMVPLQNDIHTQQQKLRLKPEASYKTLALDLRKDLDLARSHFLHRLALLGITWASITDNEQRNRGTFRESWRMAWQPEMSIDIIAASTYGTCLAQAAHNKIISLAKRPETTLQTLAQDLDNSLLANLPLLVADLTRLIEQRAAVTFDMSQLLQTVLPLAQVFRYGSVRQNDQDLLANIIDSLIERIAIGLKVACMNLNSPSAQHMRTWLLEAHQAVYLRQNDNLTQLWQQVLQDTMHSLLSAPLLRGMACRLLLDAKVCEQDSVALELSRNLSASVPALDASDWLQGFLNQQALVLLHHDWILQAIDAWVTQLNEAHFIQVLPLVRRHFANFSHSERQSLSQKIQQPMTAVPAPHTTSPQDTALLSLVDPILLQLFGLPSESLPS
ncbi:DUF5682 family protein [Vitreoscilla stercoraria]|uniref:DUF5682 family protein n=1 Tax=Vitreoscilla stercoraria TaxID=61 RepID=A0ABY4ECS8_VITST|nr:DUF5682 family protein [Vitreoscilla stercoraria]UOO93526.1 DUF5682 family protein [Vitreoscilla stercoraria]